MTNSVIIGSNVGAIRLETCGRFEKGYEIIAEFVLLCFKNYHKPDLIGGLGGANRRRSANGSHVMCSVSKPPPATLTDPFYD